MESRSSLGPLARVIAGATILAGVAGACGPAAAPAITPGGGGSPAPPGATPASSGATVGPSPSVAGRDAPPDAVLSADGGDPVTGQLGTFVWLTTGSDSPWLPGAPLAVGAGEPLTLRLVPDGDIRAWLARSVPAGTQGPDNATTLEDSTVLGEGTGNPTFAAPGPGAWTVEVFVEFAAGAGDASYFWRLEVE